MEPAGAVEDWKLEIGDFKLEASTKLLQMEENTGSSICGLSGIEEGETRGFDFAGVDDALLHVSGAVGGKVQQFVVTDFDCAEDDALFFVHGNCRLFVMLNQSSGAFLSG